MKKFLGAVGGFFKRTDYIFWILTIAASVYGFALINSVSRSADSEKGFLATQILAVGLGYICAVVISLMDYNVVCKFWYIFAAVGVWRWSTLPSLESKLRAPTTRLGSASPAEPFKRQSW